MTRAGSCVRKGRLGHTCPISLLRGGPVNRRGERERMYDWLKLVHVLGAMVWVGGAVMVQIVAIRAMASKDPVRQATFSADAEWLGMRVFTPASVIVLLAGIGIVLVSRIDLAVLIFVVAMMVLKPA